MRLRDVPKLRTGDIITCTECPERGCDGSEVKVWKVLLFGPYGPWILYYHDGNKSPFAYGMEGWVPAEWAQGVTGRKIKLVRRDE